MSRAHLPATLLFTTAMLLPALPAFSAAEESAALSASAIDVDKLVQMLDEQRELLARQEKQLKSQQERVRFLSSQVNTLMNERNLSNLAPAAGPAAAQSAAAPSEAPTEVKAVPVAGPATAGPSATVQNVAAKPEAVGIDRKPKPKDRPPVVEAVGNQGGVLLRPGQAVLEPGIEYSRSSATRVAIEGFTIIPALNIGAFEISQVDRDTTIASATGRIGVFKNFEVEARIPYVMRNDNNLTRPVGVGASNESLTNIKGEDLGDVEFAARYQFMNASGGWPFMIANLRYKTDTGKSPFEVPTDPATGLQTELPTGSGFTALQPSITAIMPSDPVVLYATIGYLYNMSNSVGGNVGEIDPGDSISASFGMGFALNDKTSFSIGYAHDYVFETKQNDNVIPNSDKLHVGRLLTGFGYRVTDKTSVNLNVDTGVTDDAPDVRIMFRVPMYFDAF